MRPNGNTALQDASVEELTDSVVDDPQFDAVKSVRPEGKTELLGRKVLFQRSGGQQVISVSIRSSVICRKRT